MTNVMIVIIIRADEHVFMGDFNVALANAGANDHFEPTKTVN
jgi:hypothetical protein